MPAEVPAQPAETATVTEEAEAGGRHIRIAGPSGPIHVWIPPGYRPERAGIALYVHGYYTDVDTAWTKHRLAEQFRASGRDALFIAPEAPRGAAQGVHYPDLEALLLEVRIAAGLTRPWGPVVAMVHSGGYRTALRWLDSRQLDQVILLDALYGGEEAFVDFARSRRGHGGNALMVVGADTLRWTEPLSRDVRDHDLSVAVIDHIPSERAQMPRLVRSRSVVYFRAQHGHMALVEDGQVIPLLLSVSQLGRLFPSGESAR